jgi:VWFA-related protein
LILARSAGGQAPAKQPDPESLRISVDVALVVLHATVVDREGRLIHNLDEQDFEVFEDGRRQQIRLFKNEDIPVTAGLVVDHSSTMRRKLPEVSAAARTFVRSSNPEDEMFVVNFNEKVSLGLPDGIRFTDSAAELEAAITRAPAGGETALYDAIAKGLTELQSGDRDGKVLVVISDGGDNASARKLTDVMKLARQSSAVIYTIGIFDDQDPDRNPAVLKRLAEETGGQAFFPKELAEVVAICERIARNIRHQYTIGYAPANPARDGAYRSVRVVARAKGRGKLSVRTRTGYIAGGDTPSDNRSRK